MWILEPERKGVAEDRIHTKWRAPRQSRKEVCDSGSHRADCSPCVLSIGGMKDRRRFILDKTAVMVVRGRTAATSRWKKKIILLPSVQC